MASGERRKRTSACNLKKIAEGFGWSMAEFFKNIEDKLPKDIKIFDEEHY